MSTCPEVLELQMMTRLEQVDLFVWASVEASFCEPLLSPFQFMRMLFVVKNFPFCLEIHFPSNLTISF